MSTNIVQIENLVKRYGDLVALDHLNLSISEGEVFGLLGPNGSGKTTAINCMLSLLKYDKGCIHIFGEEMRPDNYKVKQQIGIVLQNVAVFDELTVYENIDYFCGLYIRDKALNEQGSTIIYTSHYMEEVEQICTRIAIMDHGHVIASGTKEELKKMIKTGETITIEAIPLTSENLADIRTLPHVFDLHYEEQILTVRCTGARHNLIRLLNYLQSQDISFGQVSSELPTLNDVFLEITGKQLRD